MESASQRDDWREDDDQLDQSGSSNILSEQPRDRLRLVVPKGYAKTSRDYHKRQEVMMDLLEDGTPEALDLLLHHATEFGLLKPEEEISLAQQIERGDLEAKERLFNSNLRLVVSIALRYQNQGLSPKDLVQEGMVGLMRATELFDYRKGFRFTTYATLWIRQAIQRGIDKTGRTIRLPVNVAQRSRKIGKIERELTTKLGHEPSDQEIADAARMDINDVIEVRRADRAVVSLDKPVGEDEDTTFGSLLITEKQSTEEEVIETLISEMLLNAVEELPDNERKVIGMRFGTTSVEPKTLSQTGKQLGVSTERVRKIEERALRRLGQEASVIALRETVEPLKSYGKY